jgi:F0F1-type ATP synthase assembly protein I
MVNPCESKSAPAEKKGDTKVKKPPKWRALTIAINMGYYLVGPIFGGLFLGYLLDKWLGTHPWFTVILLVLGIITALVKTVQLGLRIGDE